MIFLKRSSALFSVWWVAWSRPGSSPTWKRVSILARRNGRVSRLSGRIDTSNVPASKRNTRGPTSNRDREHNTADPQPRLRPSLLHNMAPGRNHSWVRNNLGKRCNRLHSLQPRTGLKAREPTESMVSVGFPFRSHSPFPDTQCSSSYNHIRFRQSFTRLHLAQRNVVFFAENLYNTLIEHCVSHFHKSGNVGADHQIAGMPVVLGGFPRVFENREH